MTTATDPHGENGSSRHSTPTDGPPAGGRLLRRALLWGLLVGVLIALAVAFALHRFAAPPAEPLPVLATIPDFSLTDQAG
ncbi:MAG TPA: hypothetical protein VM617_01250, partial [Thermoanaerobaculia bacterium]|nr:hypothetical protein [Thermoanaerobaculia bacterium]